MKYTSVTLFTALLLAIVAIIAIHQQTNYRQLSEHFEYTFALATNRYLTFGIFLVYVKKLLGL